MAMRYFPLLSLLTCVGVYVLGGGLTLSEVVSDLTMDALQAMEQP